MDQAMRRAFEVVFAEWDRRYREDPRSFWSEVEHLLGQTPATYGAACSVYFIALLNELSGGQPWNTIQ